ncbi:hypothetical protein CAOG_05798 [Capsaspora owczarzaki ATCC 30864]|uniref:hypothetical protein n=1 Tax=Capsaspora owczarzaki (strain ATCC 30864) TaxID=595528 RepID=UPI0001FE2B45|nr:hypothetical protein CAOG_05798 [Capsaspora owczarzaki ATCC 30864]|eukprot:XP_004345388.1 hypothetical protein CAOG_05798 [Capsaspora owczarzaki ATCC 30864]
MAESGLADGSPLHQYLCSIGYSTDDLLVLPGPPPSLASALAEADSDTSGSTAQSDSRPAWAWVWAWAPGLKQWALGRANCEIAAALEIAEADALVAAIAPLGRRGVLSETDCDWIVRVGGDHVMRALAHPNNGVSQIQQAVDEQLDWITDRVATAQRRLRLHTVIGAAVASCLASTLCRTALGFRSSAIGAMGLATWTGLASYRFHTLSVQASQVHSVRAQLAANCSLTSRFVQSTSLLHTRLVRGIRRVRELGIVQRGYFASVAAELPPALQIVASSESSFSLPELLDPPQAYLFRPSPSAPKSAADLTSLDAITTLLHVFLEHRSQLMRRTAMLALIGSVRDTTSIQSLGVAVPRLVSEEQRLQFRRIFPCVLPRILADLVPEMDAFADALQRVFDPAPIATSPNPPPPESSSVLDDLRRIMIAAECLATRCALLEESASGKDSAEICKTLLDSVASLEHDVKVVSDSMARTRQSLQPPEDDATAADGTATGSDKPASRAVVDLLPDCDQPPLPSDDPDSSLDRVYEATLHYANDGDAEGEVEMTREQWQAVRAARAAHRQAQLAEQVCGTGTSCSHAGLNSRTWLCVYVPTSLPTNYRLGRRKSKRN